MHIISNTHLKDLNASKNNQRHNLEMNQLDMKEISKPMHNFSTNIQNDTRVRDTPLQVAKRYTLLHDSVSEIKIYIENETKN